MIKEKHAQKTVNQLKQLSQTIEKLIGDVIKDLRESEQRYRSIVEFATDAIITVDPQNRVTSWNHGAQIIFHFTESEAMNQDLDQLISRGDEEAEAGKLSQQIMQGKSIKSYEAVRYTKNGHPRHVLISASPIKNTEGQVEAASIMYKDITELKQAHEQLVQTEKQATLGVIAGSIGHELNNLIGGLLLHARLLQQSPEHSDRVREIAELMLTNLEKVTLHGKNLLSLSQPTKPYFEPVDLNQVLLGTTETLIHSGVLKHYEIDKKLCDCVQHVHGDRHLLEQVIRNLEINAAHAMPEGGTLTLQTRLSDNNQYMELIISDTGEGIDLSIQDKIFQPFFTTKSEGQGTGLGLPIVRDIIDKHKGFINLESKIGAGTSIKIGLPIVKT